MEIITEELIAKAIRLNACDTGVVLARALIGSPISWLRPADLDWLTELGLAPRIDPQAPPLDVFTRLAGDEDGRVRYAVACHPSCPADVLVLLAGVAQWYVRRVVAQHQSCPVEVLTRLSVDEDWRVRRAANRLRCNTSR